MKTSEGAKWAFEQALAISKKEIEIVTVLPNKEGKTAQLYQKNNLRVIVEDFSLPTKNPFLFFKRKRALLSLLKKEKPDIIHCHFVTNVIMLRLCLRKNRIPMIFQVPGPLHLESFFYRKAEIALARKNDYWIGTCKKTVSIYKKEHVDPKRVFLGYYGGYGGKTCDLYSTNSNKLHNEFSIPNDFILIGMVSYVYKPKRYAFQKRGIKGHEDFIDAIGLARSKNKKIIGIIIGGAWAGSEKYYKKVKKYAENKCGPSIIFTGTRDDIKDIYCELNIVVHPSHSENLGGAAESLAAGRPTISTNIGGFPDIVKNKISGITVPPKNPQQLSNAILYMIDNYEESLRMANKGKEIVKKTLDIETCAETVVDIYKKVIRNERT